MVLLERRSRGLKWLQIIVFNKVGPTQLAKQTNPIYFVCGVFTTSVPMRFAQVSVVRFALPQLTQA